MAWVTRLAGAPRHAGEVDGRIPEQCVECGFDATRWRVADAISWLDALGRWWRLATDGVGAEALNRRPTPAVWSTLEYGVHSAFVTAVIRLGLEPILAADGCLLPDPPPAAGVDHSPVTDLDAPTVVAALEREGQALGALARGAAPTSWAHQGDLPGGPVQAEALLLHAVHDASHHQFDVGRGLAALVAGTPHGRGRVLQVNASDGGVPKRAVPLGEFDHDGLVGDRQADSKHHGRPFQAVCLWSEDARRDLADAGHAVVAGSVGENLTVDGIDWLSLRPGTLLRAGTALLEVSLPAIPCHKQARWFTDGDFTRLAYEQHPDWARWYAWVREPGTVRADDPVVVQP
jgi:MOSC domain-containing protein YiiM